MRNGFLCSKILKVLLATGLCVYVGGAHTLEMEYISPGKKTELEKQFLEADFKPESQTALAGKEWTCDMYGVRTRLQVKRGVKLYKWTRADNGHNEGAQAVREYKNDDGKFIGIAGRLEDQVKLNSKGQLISRLSVTEPERQVVAYAVCDTP